MLNIRNKAILRVTTCLVCSDKANDHLHYGSIACYSCRAFFRRSVLNKSNNMCTYNGPCEITIANRKQCASCRYDKCKAVGMREDFVMTKQDKNEQKQKSEMPVAASTNQTNYSLKRKQDRCQRKKMLNEMVSKMTTDHAVRAIRIVFLAATIRSNCNRNFWPTFQIR